MKKQTTKYIALAIFLLIMFSANFVSTDLFEPGFQTFTVWFVLSLFAFTAGWLTDKVAGWKKGGIIIFAVTAASAIISLFLVSFFGGYFSAQNLIMEELILYSLRSFTLGAFGFFGMSVAEVFVLQNITEKCRANEESIQKVMITAEKEAELIVKEAEIKAEKIIFDAEKKSKVIKYKADEVESKLRELIRIERELIQKYESESE